ncbi:MAG TPA: aldo/keto reductase, partial [Fimbriimonas sp.]|nr:aldo/keto reductase [Fimbriimonas sp.]
VIPWSPLAGGVLGGVIRTSEGERRLNDSSKAIVEKHRVALTAWEDLCHEMGEKPADVALAWTLSKSFVTGPIIGPRTIEQLDGSLRALEIDITSELSGKIDAIFPGFKTSPEHYAW